MKIETEKNTEEKEYFLLSIYGDIHDGDYLRNTTILYCKKNDLLKFKHLLKKIIGKKINGYEILNTYSEEEKKFIEKKFVFTLNEFGYDINVDLDTNVVRIIWNLVSTKNSSSIHTVDEISIFKEIDGISKFREW